MSNIYCSSALFLFSSFPLFSCEFTNSFGFWVVKVIILCLTFFSSFSIFESLDAHSHIHLTILFRSFCCIAVVCFFLLKQRAFYNIVHILLISSINHLLFMSTFIFFLIKLSFKRSYFLMYSTSLNRAYCCAFENNIWNNICHSLFVEKRKLCD